MILLIVLAIIVVIAIALIMLYNKLVRMRTNVDESWSQIDVQLQRRNDLIPNLMNTVKGYSNFEQATLTKVTELRSAIMNAPQDADPAKLMQKSDELSNCLKSIFAVSEAYPDLKASAEYQQLMEELTNTENKIAYSRQLYNSTVANYNMSLQSFPVNLIAGMFHFTQREYLKADEAAKKVPEVNF